MEGNILKGGPYWDLESDIFLTITVWDEAGDSTSRDYQMNINWENEPPVILKHPDKLTTEGRYLYLTVGEGPEFDIQYSEPEGEDIYIYEGRLMHGWIDASFNRGDMVLRLSRDQDRWGTVEFPLRMEDDFDNEVDFEITVEFLDPGDPSKEKFRIIDLRETEGYWDDTMIVMGVEISGSGEMLFYNLTSIYWRINGSSIGDESPFVEILLEPGFYNISVTFRTHDHDYSDSTKIWKEIQVNSSGIRDAEEEEGSLEGSIAYELCILGLVTPGLITAPMVFLYIFFKLKKRKEEGGDEE
jgi:hypothetical protein